MKLPGLENWDTTRDGLHQVANIVGAIRVACIDPQPNDLHFSLLLSKSGFSTSTMRGGGDLEFDLSALQLKYSRGGATVFTLSAQGHSQVSLARALIGLFQDHGYSISPSMKRISMGGALEFDAALARDYLVALDRLYTALARFRAKLGGAMTPIALWPHHFDMGFIYFPEGGSDEHSDPHISYGFAPFSAGLERPYIYAYAWSRATGYIQVEAAAPAQAITEGYTGLYLAYDDLRAAEDLDGVLESRLLEFQRAATRQWQSSRPLERR